MIVFIYLLCIYIYSCTLYLWITSAAVNIYIYSLGFILSYLELLYIYPGGYKNSTTAQLTALKQYMQIRKPDKAQRINNKHWYK